MKRILLILFLASTLLSLNLRAQVWRLEADGSVVSLNNRVDSADSPAKAKGNMVRVRMEGSDRPIHNFVIVGEGVGIQKAGSPDKFKEFEIPCGEYTLGAMYIESKPTMVWDIHEKMLITSDTTILFSPDKAIGTISFRPTDCHGNALLPPSYTVEGGLKVDYTNANFASESLVNVVSHKNGLVFAVLTGASKGLKNGKVDDSLAFDFRMSNVSEDIVMTEFRAVNWLDGSSSIIQLETRGCSGSKTVGNVRDSFVKFNPEIIRTVSFNPKNNETVSKVFDGLLCYPDGRYGDARVSSVMENPDGEMNACILAPGEGAISVALSMMGCELSKMTAAGNQVSGISTAPVFYENGKWIVSDIGTAPFMDSPYKYLSDTKFINLRPGHPAFSLPAEQYVVKAGETAPVNCLLTIPAVRNQERYVQFMPHYIGMAGESRSIDNFFSEAKVAAGDKVLSDGSLPAYVKESELQKAGRVKATFENRNFKVGGVEGCSLSEYEIDFKSADTYTPGLRRLAIRNSKGEITDKIDTQHDGVLLLTAADFNLDASGRYFRQEEADIKVEYSPHGESSWTMLTMNRDSDSSLWPAFGSLYEGDLSQVSAASADGWYDLRITVRDAAGNSCVQTLSPVFRIDRLSGVECIESDTLLQQMESAEIFTLGGLRVQKEHLGAGIYVVRTDKGCFKIKVKQ